MPRNSTFLEESDLERALLRKGVGALEAGRHTCAHCGRSPLVGERVYRFPRGASVCALCRPLQRGADPVSVDVVRHSERGRTVRELRPAA